MSTLYGIPDLSYEYSAWSTNQKQALLRADGNRAQARFTRADRERVPFATVLGGEKDALPSGANEEDYIDRSLLDVIDFPYTSNALGDILLPKDTYDPTALGGDTYYNTASEFPAKLYYGIDYETTIHTLLEATPDLGRNRRALGETIQVKHDTSLIQSGRSFIPRIIPVQTPQGNVQYLNPLDLDHPEDYHRYLPGYVARSLPAGGPAGRDVAAQEQEQRGEGIIVVGGEGRVAA